MNSLSIVGRLSTLQCPLSQRFHCISIFVPFLLPFHVPFTGAECDEGEGYIPCGPGNEGLCYLNTSRCDGVTNCPASLANELICCKKDLEFGCYTQDEGHYRCYQKNLRCDASNFCQDYITPDECKENYSGTSE